MFPFLKDIGHSQRALVTAFLQYAQGVLRFNIASVERCTLEAQMMNETRALPRVFTFYKGNANFLRKWEANSVSESVDFIVREAWVQILTLHL